MNEKLLKDTEDFIRLIEELTKTINSLGNKNLLNNLFLISKYQQSLVDQSKSNDLDDVAFAQIQVGIGKFLDYCIGNWVNLYPDQKQLEWNNLVTNIVHTSVLVLSTQLGAKVTTANYCAQHEDGACRFDNLSNSVIANGPARKIGWPDLPSRDLESFVAFPSPVTLRRGIKVYRVYNRDKYREINDKLVNNLVTVQPSTSLALRDFCKIRQLPAKQQAQSVSNLHAVPLTR